MNMLTILTALIFLYWFIILMQHFLYLKDINNKMNKAIKILEMEKESI